MDGMEVMEVDSVANNRLIKIYFAGFILLMCLYFQSPYLFKINLSSLCMIVTHRFVIYAHSWYFIN